MDLKNERNKKIRANMELSTFEIPPSGDVLVLGKRCPIGAQAARRMLDSVAGGRFELIPVDDGIIEAILVRKHLLLRVDREPLVKAVVEETKAIMGEECMIKIKFEVTAIVNREI
ncbi:MAG: hypothetical protein ABII25_03390 [bacterium]